MANGLFSSSHSSQTVWRYSMACLTALLALGLFHPSVDARPQNMDTPPADDLTDEWKEAADWIATNDVIDEDSIDSWRAFPRTIVKSSSKWWERKMDDQVWDAASYQDEEFGEDYNDEKEEEENDNSNEENNSSVEEENEDDEEVRSNEDTDDNDDDENESGENGSESASSSSDNDDDYDDNSSSSTSDSMTDSDDYNEEDDDDDDDDDIQRSFVPTDRLNSFVDDKPVSYLKNDVINKAWMPAKFIDENEDSTSKKVEDTGDDFRQNIKEGGDPAAFPKTKDNEEEISDEIHIFDNPEDVNVEFSSDNGRPLIDDEDVDYSSDEKLDNDDNSLLQSDVKMLGGSDVAVTIDEEIPEKEEIEIQENGDDNDNHIDGLKDDVDFIIPGIDKRGIDDNVEEVSLSEDAKEEGDEPNDVFVSTDAVKLDFGRGEKLDGSKQSLQSWKGSETVAQKKGTDNEEEFEDWADWDDSVFDDYDKKQDDDEKDDKMTKVEEADYDDDDDDDDFDDDDEDDSDSSDDDEDEDSSESDDDDDDDYDDSEEDEDEYDDDDYSQDDDEDDDSDEEIENSNNKNNNKIWQPLQAETLHSSAQEAIKDEHIEAIDQDAPHYNKGIIYDDSHPFKKSKQSVKKDLGAHGSSYAHHDDQQQTGLKSNDNNNDNDHNSESAKLVKQTSIDNHSFQQQHSEEKMSTGLESLTSPNPAPTVTTWTDTSLSSLSPSPSSFSPSPSPPLSSSSPSPSPSPASPSPSPWSSKDGSDLMFGDEAKEDVDDFDDAEEEFIDSYPLELCRLDYECRSGRTCVDGVCKCFKASFCAGHYKPVCGDDGVEYPSHCELHRSACINRIKIRVDRSGKCLKSDDGLKETKSWLMEQERLLREDREKTKAQQDVASHSNNNAVQIPKEEIEEFPKNVNGDLHPSTTSVPEVNSEMKHSEESESKPHFNTKCTWNEMASFKEALLMYHCQKFIEPNCKLEVKTDRQYLTMLMFSYYDRNFDFFLTANELRDKERDEHFSNSIIKNCHLEDFIRFADADDMDQRLTVSEFTQSYDLPRPSNVMPSDLEVVSTLASAGDGLELKCGVKATQVIWKRYGVQLKDDQKNHKLMVFEDGALFFSKLGLHHIGNYTCYDVMDEKNAQVHRLNIQTSPVMEVSPVTQIEIQGADVEIKCHTEGVPKPTVSWRHNGKNLLNSKHINVFSGEKHIVIHDVQADRDSGEYICRAHSQAGTVEQAVTVTIHPPTSYPNLDLIRNEGTFLVFHESGITAYDPLTCLARHKVNGNFGKFKFIPDVMDSPLTLCKGSGNKSCQWGDAVKVGAEFVYVSQPDQNRVLIVEAGHYWNPLQVIDTDHRPYKLQYVPHLDQVWVLCRSQSSDSDKTVVVIRDASQYIQHRSVHTRPVGNHFDTVKDLFIAPSNDLHHEFDHGYVTHAGKTSLSKINLEDMSYVQSIDLSVYGCMPVHVTFVPLGGHVVVQCVSQKDNHTLQLVMDYLTSAIVKATSISGKPLVSPDSRHLITVDQHTGKVVVVSVSNEGLMETTYEVTVSARISDVSFIPATFHHGYDLILTSAEDDDLIVMNLVTGKVEKMSGSTRPQSSQAWQPSPLDRTIVASDPMSNFVMTPSKSSLSIINFKFKHVDCELTELARGDKKVIVHVASSRVTV